MEFNSLQSELDDFSGDDTDLSALLPAPKKVIHAREDVLSEDERVSARTRMRKRKIPASSGRKPSTAKRPRTRDNTSASLWPASRGRSQQRFSPEETERWIDIILKCRAEGLLTPKSRHLDSAWDKIVGVFAREFPEKEWTRETMEAKLRTEKRRSDRFLAALAILGPSYDKETSTGEEFDAITPTEYSDDDDWPGNMQVSRFSRIREDSGDPVLAIENGSASAILRAPPEIPTHRAARGQALENTIDRFDTLLASSLMNAATQLSKVPGSDAVISATQDLQARYAGNKGQPGQYSVKVIVYCLQQFAATPMLAVQWNGLSERLKDTRMARMARELAELEQKR